MEPTFIKANSSNLPRMDVIMLSDFIATNKELCASKKVKSSSSSRQSYGDDAINFVQLKREGSICTVKCKICPDHKDTAKQYAVTLLIDEVEERVISVDCHDCVASQGCTHALTLLMWIHRRSEEPSCEEVQCYWRKSNLPILSTSLKFMTAKELSKGSPMLPSNPAVFEEFLEEAKKRKLDCKLLKYQQDNSYN